MVGAVSAPHVHSERIVVAVTMGSACALRRRLTSGIRPIGFLGRWPTGRSSTGSCPSGAAARYPTRANGLLISNSSQPEARHP
jgi:hypothetical protein